MARRACARALPARAGAVPRLPGPATKPAGTATDNRAVTSSSNFDAIVLGAGAAGLFCAAQAGQRGLRVLLIDHFPRGAEKVRISGGGRANFTNRELDPAAPHKHFLGANPHFCRSALARFTPADFLALLDKHASAVR